MLVIETEFQSEIYYADIAYIVGDGQALDENMIEVLSLNDDFIPGYDYAIVVFPTVSEKSHRIVGILRSLKGRKDFTLEPFEKLDPKRISRYRLCRFIPSKEQLDEEIREFEERLLRKARVKIEG